MTINIFCIFSLLNCRIVSIVQMDSIWIHHLQNKSILIKYKNSDNNIYFMLLERKEYLNEIIFSEQKKRQFTGHWIHRSYSGSHLFPMGLLVYTKK